MLDPALRQAGFGSYREEGPLFTMGAAMDVNRGLEPSAAATYPILWPGAGATAPLTEFRAGSPDPLSGCLGYAAPAGAPLILQLGPDAEPLHLQASTLEKDGVEVEHCAYTGATYTNDDLGAEQRGREILSDRGAAVLQPRAPLTAGSTYAASITTSTGASHTWSFTVAAAPVSTRPFDPTPTPTVTRTATRTPTATATQTPTATPEP
jgi:hypothetical protein